jgi:adenine-specific DNA-methyltransferase
MPPVAEGPAIKKAADKWVMANRSPLARRTAGGVNKHRMEEISNLQDLTREELIALLTERVEGGVKLEFAGKSNARRLARKVRPRVQRTMKKYGLGTPEAQSRNLVLEGDNLQAMVTLYRERGQVDLILTDPPYNTGKDFRYNDRWDEDPNDPGMGELVSEDEVAKHTKWMRFMLPRLKMMQSMLKPTGVLAICIDHRELFHLGQMLDELFGEENRLAIINWEKSASRRPDNNHVSTSTEYVLVYAKDIEKAKTASLDREEADNKRYGNPDSDPDGLWREGNLTARSWAESSDYVIQSPFTGAFHYPAGEGSWRHPKRNIKKWLEEWGSEYEERQLDDGHVPALMLKDGFSQATKDRALERLGEDNWPFIWFGRDGNGRPRTKTYLDKIKKGKVPVTYWADEDLIVPEELGSVSWDYTESGRSSDGVAELTAIVGQGHNFTTVKPLKLMMKIIQLWCPADGLVMDPFGGSGTTAHAVLALNHTADTSRRFILVEQGRPEKGDSYARSLTTDRLSRVVRGDWDNGKGVPLGAGYRFMALDKKVDADALLAMEREEMVDTVIASYFDTSRRRGGGLITTDPSEYRYLVAKNGDEEGFFLVWEGPDKNTDFTEDVYEQCSEEAQRAGLKPNYHVYARYNLFQTENVRFYQIPDRILIDFGLDLRNDAFTDEDER